MCYPLTLGTPQQVRLGTDGARSQLWGWAAGNRSWGSSWGLEPNSDCWEWRAAGICPQSCPSVGTDSPTAKRHWLSTFLRAMLGTSTAWALRSVVLHWKCDLRPDLFAPVLLRKSSSQCPCWFCWHSSCSQSRSLEHLPTQTSTTSDRWESATNFMLLDCSEAQLLAKRSSMHFFLLLNLMVRSQ